MRKMEFFRLMQCFCFAALFVFGSSAIAQEKKEFRAGAATSNITPEIGGQIVGNFGPNPSHHVHDELFARCIVLDDGETTLALVVCDLLGVSTTLSPEARAIIEEKAGIPAANVLICATHTHSGTNALTPRGDLTAESDPNIGKYQDFVARRIADGVRRAKNLLRPAEFAVTTVDVPEHVYNRRWILKPGTMPANPFGKTDDKAKMNPSAGSPDLVEPAGPVDPTVTVLSFREPDGKPIALLASYSMHYVGGVPAGEISSDYFGRFAEIVTELTGTGQQQPPFVPILSNGTSGDVTSNDRSQRLPSFKPYEKMQKVARDVAVKVLASLEGATYTRDVPLAARFRTIDVAYRKPDAEMLAWAEKTFAAGQTKTVDVPYTYAMRVRAIANRPENAAVPLQVLRIGNLCIGTMPCEVFCEIGMEFKKRSPIQPALLMSLSHGYMGYLPPPHQHDLGGYETWLGTNQLEREASNKMLAVLLEMAKEVQPTTGK